MTWIVLALLLASAAGAAAQGQGPQELRVTLLGTGAPPPDRERMGPSVLVEANGERLLFDVGRGATSSLRAYGLKLGDIERVFLTHLHADHLIGLPDLWLTGHHRDTFGQRPAPMTVHGPPGLAALLDGLATAYAGVAEGWGMSSEAIRMVPREFGGEGVVYADAGLRVTTFRVAHGDNAYGFRIDYRGYSVVLSGDTGYSENLIRHAAGADLLIHEVFFVGDDSGMDPALRERLERIHTTPAAAARVFSSVRPRLAVATHLGGLGAATPLLEARVRDNYPGRFEAGEDLMTIVVGDSVRIIRRD